MSEVLSFDNKLPYSITKKICLGILTMSPDQWTYTNVNHYNSDLRASSQGVINWIEAFSRTWNICFYFFWALKAWGSYGSTFIKTASLKCSTVCCLSSWIELFISLRWSNNSQSPLEQNQSEATQTQPTPTAYSLWPYCEIRNQTGVTIMSGLLSAHSKYMVKGLQCEELVISQPHLQQKQRYSVITRTQQ